ncbi:hypothetical protein DFH09DRAFT_1081661 [Mycena vulgaris]|nr:hypothetical protein DFH09DRAFT_1081661 [Mycena vulgaris]
MVQDGSIQISESRVKSEPEPERSDRDEWAKVDIEFEAAARSWVINIGVPGVVVFYWVLASGCVRCARERVFWGGAITWTEVELNAKGKGACTRDDVGVDLVLVLAVIVPGWHFEWECELRVRVSTSSRLKFESHLRIRWIRPRCRDAY